MAADFVKLREEIRANIKPNNRQEITGAVAQGVLVDMVDVIEEAIEERESGASGIVLDGEVKPQYTPDSNGIIHLPPYPSQVTWDNISGKPSWIGSSKPTYEFIELTTHPTTLSGYGITDAQEKITSTNKLDYSLIANTPTIPTELSQLTEDANHRLVSDTNKESWNGKYSKPQGGIPISDLAASVQESLGKADTAIQEIPTNATLTIQTSETNQILYNGKEARGITIPWALSMLTEDATHRLTTDTEKTKWNAMLPKATWDDVFEIDGTLLKVKNGRSLRVDGSLVIGAAEGGGGGGGTGNVMGIKFGSDPQITTTTGLLEVTSIPSDVVRGFSAVQSNASLGAQAYSWGNHAGAGYAYASALGNYLQLSGGTLSGNLTMGMNSVVFTNVATPDWNAVIANNAGIRILNTLGTAGAGAVTSYGVCLYVHGHYGFQLANIGGQDNLHIRGVRDGNITADYQPSPWRELIHSGNISSQSVSYASSAGSVAWDGVSGRPTALSAFTDDVVSGHYLPLSGGTMSGVITTRYNTVALDFRAGHASYNSKVEYMTNGNEALVFANKNPVTSYMFFTGVDLTDRSDWYNLGTPAMQIVQNCVYINELIGSDTTPEYNLKVAGSFNATSGYINGNAIYHSGNANLSTVEWYCSNLTASGTVAPSADKTYTLGTASAYWDDFYVKGVIHAYHYNKATNQPFIVFDKPGSYYVGIGPDGTTNRIKFGPVNDISSSAPSWIDASTFASNEWYFQGNIFATGNLTVTGALNIGVASDARLKDNVARLADATSVLRSLRGVEYDWNETATSLYSSLKGHDVGMIAQEVESYIPSAISPIFENYKRLDYTKVVPYLVEGWQEHDDEIVKLKERVKELERELARLAS